MVELARARTSVFAKLLGIMFALTISLLVLVSAFFMFVLMPALTRALAPFIDDYAQKIAASQPGYAETRAMADRLGFDVRYEGPDGRWSTSPSIPSITEVRSERRHDWILRGRGYHLATAPNGGVYAFRWTFMRNTAGAHYALFALLLLLIGGSTVLAHLTIRRTLRPLRALGDGVKRLSAGQLDVVLPAAPRDEFGALTDGFNEMVARVRDMIRTRDQLLIDVSHELRSPLTRMRVALELLAEGPHRAGMTADVAEMEAMITELLERERLRDDKGMRIARVDLAAIVRDVTGDSGRVRIVSLPREMAIDADGEKIRTVIRNLVENAVKYSLPDSAPVEISAACDERSAVVRISDDGPGIPESDLSAIFEPFFRVDRARTKTPAGYGLGLSICKRIVEAHGGTITAQNRLPRGATFVLTLPRTA